MFSLFVPRSKFLEPLSVFSEPSFVFRSLVLVELWFVVLALRVAPEPFVAQVRAILDMDDALRNELHEVRVPALVITGSQDILTPISDAEELAELLPNSELAMVRGAAHGFMFEQAATFNRIVGDFLKRVVRGDGDGHQLPISATDIRGNIPADLQIVAGT